MDRRPMGMIKYHPMFSTAKIPSVFPHTLKSKEDTKDKAERSKAEVEAEERAAKEEEEAALKDMVQVEVEYWESQERAMIG